MPCFPCCVPACPECGLPHVDGGLHEWCGLHLEPWWSELMSPIKTGDRVRVTKEALATMVDPYRATYAAKVFTVEGVIELGSHGETWADLGEDDRGWTLNMLVGQLELVEG